MKPFIFFLLLTASILAQTGSITGRITQAETGAPFGYTEITVDDTLHTYSDYRGSYTIRNLTPGRNILVYSSANLVSRIDTVVIHPRRTMRHNAALRRLEPEPTIIIQKWQ